MFLQSPFSSLPTGILKPLALLGILSLLSAGLVAGNSSSALANGACGLGPTADGTSGTPYLVATAEDLAKVGVGDCALSAHYRQTENITLANLVGGNHTPIGNDDSPFTGVFDGNDKRIERLRVVGDLHMGLFGVTSNATLDDIYLKDVSVRSAGGAGFGDKMGSVVGLMKGGTLSDSFSQDVEITGVRSLGGLVGRFEGNALIEDSLVGGSIKIEVKGPPPSGNAFGAGGILGTTGFGDSPGIIRNSHVNASGSISVINGFGDAGGFAGSLEGKSQIIDSSVSGNLTVSADAWAVGGLVGSNLDGSISSSVVRSGITVLGTTDGSANEALHAGGLVGYNGNSNPINNSYTFALVTGANDVGGFVGENRGFITNSYAAGGLYGTGTTGGFAAKTTRDITNSFWDTETLGTATSAGGTGRTTTEMKTLATFTDASWSITSKSAFGFDSTISIWGIGASLNCGYPILYWEQDASVSCGEPEPTISGVRAFRTLNAAAFEFETSVRGTFFYLVYEAADPAPNAQTIINQGASVHRGKGPAFGGEDQSAGISGITDDTPYKVYLVTRALGNANNISAITAFDFTRSAAVVPPPAAGGSSGITLTTPATSEAIKKVTRLSKLSGSSSALTKKARSDVRASVRSMTTVTSAVCTAFVSNPRVASFTKKQARERAVRACNIVKRLQPAAEVRTRVFVVKDAKLPRLRSVRVSLTGR